MIQLTQSLAAWSSESFSKTLKAELEQLNHALLPLQSALAQTSYVSESPIQASILNYADNGEHIIARVAIFYHGIIAGSCCSDDPTPANELPEYCELEISINKATAETSATLICTQ